MALWKIQNVSDVLNLRFGPLAFGLLTVEGQLPINLPEKSDL